MIRTILSPDSLAAGLGGARRWGSSTVGIVGDRLARRSRSGCKKLARAGKMTVVLKN